MNFCPNCGGTLTKNANFCSSCGHSMEEIRSQNSMNEVAAAVETTVEAPVKKRIPKLWLIIAIIAGVLAAGTSAFGFFMTKSPMTMYLLAEQKSIKQLQSNWDEKYGELAAYQQLLLKKPSVNEMTISGNVEVPKEEITPEIEMLQEVLSKAALKINSEQDPVSQASKVSMGLEYDSANAINVELYQSKELIGLKIPVLYDKSFYLNTDDYGQFMRMIDPYYEGPEKLDFNTNILEDLPFTDEEKSYLTKRYRAFLLSELKEEMFTLKKDVTFVHEGQTMKTKEVTLKLSEEQTKSLMSNWVKHLIEDDELHKMIADRVVKLNEYSQFDQSGVVILSSDNVIRELKNALAEMNKGINELSVPHGFKSVILLDSKGQIISRNIEFSLSEGNEVLDFTFSSKNIALKSNGDRDKEWKMAVSPQSDLSSNFVLSSVNNIRVEKGKQAEKLIMGVLLETNGVVEIDLSLNVQSTFNELKNGKLDAKHEFQLSSNVNDSGYGMSTFTLPVARISGTIEQRSETNVKKEFSNQLFSIELLIDDEYESGKVKLTVDSKSKINQSLKVPSANEGNGLNILQLTEEDMYDLQQELTTKFMKLVEELGISENSYSFFDDFEVEDSYYDESDYDDDDNYYGSYYLYPERLYEQKCSSCHGGYLEGGVGPALDSVGSYYSKEELSSIIANGRGAMPAGLLRNEEADVVAEWLADNFLVDEYWYEDEDEVVYRDGYHIYSNTCASCHGGDLEGGVGPALSSVGSYLYAEEIYEIVMNGQGAMPGGMLDHETAKAISLWLANNYY